MPLLLTNAIIIMYRGNGGLTVNIGSSYPAVRFVSTSGLIIAVCYASEALRYVTLRYVPVRCTRLRCEAVGRHLVTLRLETRLDSDRTATTGALCSPVCTIRLTDRQT